MALHMTGAYHLYIQALFDCVFPPSAEALCVRTLTPRDVESLASHRVMNGVHTLSSFHDTRVTALIHEAKFRNNRRAHELLAALLNTFIPSHKSVLWMPIPLSPERMRSRGYNQVHEVLRHSNVPSGAIRGDILKRVRNTRPQTELQREDRLTNMRGAFRVPEGVTLRNQNVVVVDDVMTTGATLRAAEAELRQHGVRSITLLALAH